MNVESIFMNQIKHGSIVSPKGFYAAGLHSGVKKSRNDLAVLYCDTPAQAAAVYTLNQVKAAPIYVTKDSLAQSGTLQAVVINSGNANACTGEQGMKDAYAMRKQTASKFDIPDDYVAVASTGVIGLEMPMDKIIPHIDVLKMGKEPAHVNAFEEAILTTDTCTKSICFQTEIDGKIVTMAGAAKGSGMIEPNMGTMLSFLTTDAVIESNVLEKALKEVVDKTFNCITVDGDTSTNDMVLLLASGQAENKSLHPNHPEWKKFLKLLQSVAASLAKMIARDGEGATKLIEVTVNGAIDEQSAIKTAKTIVGSSLVKSAVFGKDPNWGRIICAIGYSEVDMDPDTIDLAIGPIPLLKQSEPVPFSEEVAKEYLEEDTIHIEVDMHMGKAEGKAWGCDLTYDYVQINASYRS